ASQRSFAFDVARFDVRAGGEEQLADGDVIAAGGDVQRRSPNRSAVNLHIRAVLDEQFGSFRRADVDGVVERRVSVLKAPCVHLCAEGEKQSRALDVARAGGEVQQRCPAEAASAGERGVYCPAPIHRLGPSAALGESVLTTKTPRTLPALIHLDTGRVVKPAAP